MAGHDEIGFDPGRCNPGNRSKAPKPGGDFLATVGEARLAITDGPERGECALADFLADNAELDAEDLDAVAALAVGERHAVPVHCGFVVVERTA